MKSRFIDTRMFKYIDWLLFANIAVLVLLSFVVITSAVSSSKNISEGSSVMSVISQLDLSYTIQQIKWFIVGIVAMFIVLLPDYHAISEYFKWIYLILIVLLVAVLLFGSTINGTKGWFRIGTSGFQPSEIGKTAIIIMLAKMISDRTKGRDGGIKKIRDIAPIVAVFIVPFALIVIEPDLGTALVYAFTFFSMLFMAKTSIKIILGLMAGIGIAIPVGWSLLADYQKNRIYAALGITTPDMTQEQQQAMTFQSDHAQAAAGSGQLTGKGLFSLGGASQLTGIPEKHTDFIFASTTEAVGFIGAMMIILLYIVLLARTFYLATKAKDELGSLIIIGVFAMTLVHIFENIGMNLGVMPITGIPLPFLSYGGSNLLTNMIAFGLVINVSMRRQRWGLKGGT